MRCRWAILLLAVALLPGCWGGRPTKSAEPSASDDPWAPWRKPARPETAAPYEVAPEARVVPRPDRGAADVAAPPFILDLASAEISDTRGVEVTVPFRLERVPPARLEASQGLIRFSFDGPGGRSFWLHAYSRRSALLLNGLASNRQPPWEQTRVCRGAATPGSAPGWDTAPHVLQVAWCKGQLVAKWDGLVILHLIDPRITYLRFSIDQVSPGEPFGAPAVGPVEVRSAIFSAYSPGDTAR